MRDHLRAVLALETLPQLFAHVLLVASTLWSFNIKIKICLESVNDPFSDFKQIGFGLVFIVTRWS